MKRMPLLFGSVVLLHVAGAGNDLFLVWERRADLYRDRHIDGVLYRHEVVAATAVTADEDWLELSRGGRTYRVRRRGLRSEHEVETEFARAAARSEQRVTEREQALEDVTAQLRGLQDARRQVERDETVSYMLPSIEIDRSTAAANRGALPSLSSQPRYIRKLKSNTAKRLARDLRKKIDATTQRMEELRDQVGDARAKMAADKVRAAAILDLFARYRQAPADYRQELFRVGPAGAALYEDQGKKVPLRRQTLVRAVIDPAHRDRLQVRWNGHLYDAIRKQFARVSDLRGQWAADKARLEETTAAVTRDLDEARRRQRRLQDLALQLDIQSETTGNYRVLADLPYQHTRRSEHWSYGIVETFDRSDVRRLLRQWRDDLDAGTAEVARLRQRQAELRQAQVDLALREKELQRQMTTLTAP